VAVGGADEEKSRLRSSAEGTLSILETAGSGQDERAILQLEERWKAKLASRLHGLNRN